MRRALLSQGCFGLGLAVYLAHAGCGGDAAGICDFNECVPEAVSIGDASAGSDGTVEGPDGTVEGGGGQEGDGQVNDPDVVTPDAQLPDGGLFCGFDASTTICGGDGGCVDTTSSAENCGACGHVCPAPDGGMGSAACSASACTFACSNGYHACNGECLPNTDDPSVDSCLVSDAFGVFVVSGGTGTGTQASPLGSIASAMALAHSSGKGRVFVCAQGTYTTELSIGSNATGVAVSGGFSACPASGAWTYTAGKKSVVAPSAPGLALSVSGASVAFFDMEFDAMDGVNPGDSSIAGFIASAPSASFTRSVLKAGVGQTGANASAIAGYTSASTSGAPGTATNGGGPVSVVCANGGTSAGGPGGQPFASGSSGLAGTPAITPVNPALATGAGGDATLGNCNAGSAGAYGSYGAGGASGAGAAANGSVTPSGWSPSAGAAGGNGGVGQGGGGGASLDATGGGGGGGAGGCGGTGGAGGGPGGSSIALLVYNSATVSVTSSSLTSGTAGNGGNGATGQVGQLAGNAGAAPSTVECNGGAGGAGGSGGGGGGGAGGVSAAIGWAGTTAPTTAGSTLSTPIGFPAAGGLAGGAALAAKLTPPASNGGTAGTPGQAGVVQQVVQLP